MDPASLASEISGTLPVLGSLIGQAKELYAAAKGCGDTDIAQLIAELEALERALSKLKAFLAEKNTTNAFNDAKFAETSVLRACTTSCRAKLRDLLRTLDGRTNGSCWPLSEQEHEKTLCDIRSFTMWFQFALSVDGIRLLAQNSDGVKASMSQQLDQFETMRGMQISTTQVREALVEQSPLLDDAHKFEKREHLINWISSYCTRNDERHRGTQDLRP
jgi:hypothetical protein